MGSSKPSNDVVPAGWPRRTGGMSSLSTHDLAPADELRIRLHTVDSFQASIRHADAKAATLLTTHAALATLLTADVGGIRAIGRAGAAPTLALAAVGVMFLLSTVMAAIRLLGAVRPRLGTPTRPNRFAFPGVARDGYAVDAAATIQLDEAADLAQLLARVATVKYQHVARSLPWLAATAIGAAGWLCLAGWYG